MLARSVALSFFALVICWSASAQMLYGNNPERSNAPPDLPTGFSIVEVTEYEFDRPVAIAVDPAGRLFIAEQRGRIYIVDGNETIPTPFIDIEDEVLFNGDRGLLGIALDPNFGSNGYIYLYYIVDFEATNDAQRLDAFGRITRYTVDAFNPDVADPASRHVIIGETFGTGIPACFFSHNGGRLVFGSDGSLLVSTGDAAHFDEVDSGGLYPECFGPDRLDTSEDIGAFRSLRIESLAGKILRISPESGLGYSSNPFYTGNPSDNASKVWAYGLRNPFRFASAHDGSNDPDDGQPSTLFITDVGWRTWEELEPVYGGENLGWPCREGPEVLEGYEAASPATNGCNSMSSPTFPHYFWSHFNPDHSHPPGHVSFALIAGGIYRGNVFPEPYQNSLFYVDYLQSWIGYARRSETGDLVDHQLFGTQVGSVVEMVYDQTTESFVLADAFLGKIKRLALVGPVANRPDSPGLPHNLTIESVHPNPSSNFINVSWTSPFAGRTTLSVFDMLGRKLYTEVITSGLNVTSKQLDTRSYSRGVYRLVLSNDGGQVAAAPFTVVR